MITRIAAFLVVVLAIALFASKESRRLALIFIVSFVTMFGGLAYGLQSIARDMGPTNSTERLQRIRDRNTPQESWTQPERSLPRPKIRKGQETPKKAKNDGSGWRTYNCHGHNCDYSYLVRGHDYNIRHDIYVAP